MYGGDCCYCGRHLLWGGMGWLPCIPGLHDYWRRYWLTRLATALTLNGLTDRR